MVGADLQGLIPAHDQAGLLVLLVLQQTHITSATLLPLLALTVELEQLGAHLEHLLLKLLVGLGLNLLGQANDGLEVNFRGLGSFLLLQSRKLLVHTAQISEKKIAMGPILVMTKPDAETKQPRPRGG